MTRIYLILPEESKAHLGIIWHEKYCFLNLEVKFADKVFFYYLFILVCLKSFLELYVKSKNE